MSTRQDALMGDLLGVVRRDRQRRSRWRRFGSFLGDLLVNQIGYALGALLGGWMFMLAVDVAHARWLPALPTIGYWWAALIVWLLRGVFSQGDPAKSGGAK